jgi:glucose/mannose-6-phosphate isomerase
MDKLIAAFPSNIQQALEIADKATIRMSDGIINNVVICGMGGSGIGGKIVAQWLQHECKVPILSCQDYELPAFVNEHTLVIGSSYSGETEETLFAIKEAHAKGARIIGICSGGTLKTFCEANDYDVITVPGGNPPRTALAFSLVQLVAIFTKLNFVPSQRLIEIERGRQIIVNEIDKIHSEAKLVASILEKKVPIVYAGANYEAITIRAKQQFNENSKELGWQHVIPEMNHNELVGWGGGDNRYGAWFLQTGDLSERNNKRFEISVEITKKHTDSVHVSETLGTSIIEKSIYLIHLIDWASLYLSNLKNGDPIEIRTIDFLKGELAKMK